MTHEFKHLIEVAYAWKKLSKRSVMASVVALDGSSYRRPGVRMLISETGAIEGAVSGGCVEKEIIRQAHSVFKTGIPKLMTYDGRFRLGCEGVLYILIEPLEITDSLYDMLNNTLLKRQLFSASSYFKSDFVEDPSFGTLLKIKGDHFPMRSSFALSKKDIDVEELQVFYQEFQPIFQLHIFGAEHDTVQLCQLASQIGWQVHIVASSDEQKTIDYFRGATSLSAPLMNAIDVSTIGEDSAVVLMSHSFNKDLQYLSALKDTTPAYLGLLGPSKRRERLFSELLNVAPETPYEFFENIHGPTGLNIGAESASEIAISIIAEILSVIRDVNLMSLREKSGKIHD